MVSAMVKEQLEGCKVRAHNGAWLYTPDGQGNYAALWTRDFSYMVSCAAEFIPARDIANGIAYILSGARAADGWIPDRVYPDGRAVYVAGGEPPFARDNLDNGCFAVLLAADYVRKVRPQVAAPYLRTWLPILQRGVDALPVGDNGLVYNDPADPHSPYGFTDCIAKTGYLAMESLLMWQALNALVWLSALCGIQATDETARARQIETALCPCLMNPSGLLLAADRDCRQIDIWANCYAVSIGFPLPPGAARTIGVYLADHYDGVVSHGQIRHLPEGEYWQRLLTPVPPGEYQNGAFWATATGWFADAVAGVSPLLAHRALRDVLEDFERSGVYECINPPQRKLRHYVVSAAAVWQALKKHPLG